VSATGRRILVVNADDFGLSEGVNAGVIEAHESGIVTSASLMVTGRAAAEAAGYARSSATLSSGLHADLCHWEYESEGWVAVYERVDVGDREAVAAELEAQLGRFRELVGREPSHLDSHQHVHLEEPAASVFTEEAARLAVPVRRLTPGLGHVGDFYGQTGRGEPLPEAIQPQSLEGLIRRLRPGVTELACHPGRGVAGESSYGPERERELAALCAPEVRAAIDGSGVVLASFGDLRVGGDGIWTA
jgi:predicted glycoside hydrolase/deacetylase ChbG (UPF0249 family)